MAGRPRKYDWEGWFDQPVTKIWRGLDYHCSQWAMICQVKQNAQTRGLRVRVTDNHESITIEVIGARPHTDKVTVAS